MPGLLPSPSPPPQILEDGRLTDSQGRTVSFKNAMVILTSNIGSRVIAAAGRAGAGGGGVFSRGGEVMDDERMHAAQVKADMNSWGLEQRSAGTGRRY